MALRSLKAAELAAMTRFLRNYARAQLHNADQADDVVQDALAAALAPHARYDGRSTLRTWLVGILRHKITDHIRAAARSRQHISPPCHSHELDADAEPGSAQDPREEVDLRGDPARIVAARQTLAAVGRALERVPQRNARAYVLCELEGYETGEVCERLGMSPGHLWVAVHRARKAVRASLGS